MRISDWSSDVCSSDLVLGPHGFRSARERRLGFEDALKAADIALPRSLIADGNYTFESGIVAAERLLDLMPRPTAIFSSNDEMAAGVVHAARQRGLDLPRDLSRSDEHTSELQSLMRISYAVLSLKTNKLCKPP